MIGAGFLAGFLIGAIAVGGAILVPLLVLGGIAPHQAVAMSLAAFVAPGALGAFWATRAGFSRPMLAALAVAAGTGAALGTFANRLVSEGAVAWIIIVAALAAAVLHVVPQASADNWLAAPTMPQSSVAGLITGAGSAISRTSGPVLVPFFTFLGIGLRPTIVLSQGVQAPIAVAATTLNLTAGVVPIRGAIVLGLSLAAGMVCGNRFGRELPVALLNRILAAALLISALLMIAQQL